MGHVAICQLLLERNADVSDRDKGGCTALNIAHGMGYSEVASVLREFEGNSRNNQRSSGVLTRLLTGTKQDPSKKYEK